MKARRWLSKEMHLLPSLMTEVDPQAPQGGRRGPTILQGLFAVGKNPTLTTEMKVRSKKLEKHIK